VLVSSMTGDRDQPARIQQMAYNPQKDFAPVTLAATTPLVLVVPSLR
jgi:hypothetical protein